MCECIPIIKSKNISFINFYGANINGVSTGTIYPYLTSTPFTATSSSQMSSFPFLIDALILPETHIVGAYINIGLQNIGSSFTLNTVDNPITFYFYIFPSSSVLISSLPENPSFQYTVPPGEYTANYPVHNAFPVQFGELTFPTIYIPLNINVPSGQTLATIAQWTFDNSQSILPDYLLISLSLLVQ